METLKIGKCKNCAPEEWPVSEEHMCADNDDSRVYGTISYSLPVPGGALRVWVHIWPRCVQCDEEYCTYCGEEAWYQCL